MHAEIYPLLIGLAAIICLLTAMALALMLQIALTGSRERLRLHLITTAIVTGSGVWATHFVAMLGHGASMDLAYLPGPTFASLVFGLVGYGLALELFEYRRGRLHSALAGLICGLTTATLHFVGIKAISFDGVVAWNYPLAAFAVAAGSLLSALAVTIIAGRGGARRLMLGAAVFAASVLTLHMVAMEAMHLEVLGQSAPSKGALPPLELSLLVAFGSLLLGGWALSLSMSRHSFERLLGRHTREFSLLVQGLRDTAIYMIDPEGKVLTWNEGAHRLKGYRAKDIIGHSFAQFYSAPDQSKGVPQDALKSAREMGSFKTRGYRYRKDGTRFWADVSIEPVYDEQDLIGFVKITQDITAQIEATDNLNRVRSDLEAATANMVQGLILYDAQGRVKLVNARLAQIFNVPEDSFRPGMNDDDIGIATIHRRAAMRGGSEADAARVVAKIKTTRQTNGYVQIDVDDALTISINRRLLPNGEKVVTVEDVTERQRAAERLEFMANHDALTGLFNREAFRRALDTECAIRPSDGQVLAVAIVDLDLFKEVNDIHGHAVGDALLQEVSARLAGAVEGMGIAARLGGDEFAVFAKIDEGELSCAAFAETLVKAVNFAAVLLGKGIASAGSVGIALSPQDGVTTKALIGNADLAMYRAKTTLRAGWLRYDKQMGMQSREQRELQEALKMAVEREEFYLAYQPQCSVSTGEVIGYEALLRWKHERFGSLSPERFVKAAEDNGLILPIGEWVLKTACIEAAGWDIAQKIAVNISAIQLVQQDFHQQVSEALVQSGLPANRLEIEITESVIITDKVRALHNLRRIKALGVTVAIDDFGTGYSSLDTLNSFEFDKIKIDRMFLIDAKRNEGARAIIRAVLALGRSLGLPVLAEGVESEEDLALLREEECGEAQGFYFGRPDLIEAHKLSA